VVKFETDEIMVSGYQNRNIEILRKKIIGRCTVIRGKIVRFSDYKK
jgi:hypothetical protein